MGASIQSILISQWPLPLRIQDNYENLKVDFWIVRNSGPIFRHLWTKCSPNDELMCGSDRSLQRCFQFDNLLLHFAILEIIAIKSRNCPKLRPNFDILAVNLLGHGPISSVNSSKLYLLHFSLSVEFKERQIEERT